MKEAESWTLHVDAKANKFNFKLKAKRFFFPNLYELSFKLKTHPRVSFLKKSKIIKILEKCRIKHIKKNTCIGAKRNSRSRCISCEGRNSGNLVKFYNWIAGEKDIKGTSLNKFHKMKMFMGVDVIYRLLMIMCSVLVSYWVLTLAVKHYNLICNAVGYFYKMFQELGLVEKKLKSTNGWSSVTNYRFGL